MFGFKGFNDDFFEDPFFDRSRYSERNGRSSNEITPFGNVWDNLKSRCLDRWRNK